MSQHEIASTAELEPGERILKLLEGREIAVFNLDGEIYAYTSWCPHQGGPCGEGSISGTLDATFDPETLQVRVEWTKDGEILNCPWHGWEYDIRTGECISRSGVRLPSHEVTVKDGKIFVDL